jgi:hypothetical protein
VLKAFPETAVKVVGNYTRMTPDEIASTDISKKEFKISFWASSKWGWRLAHGHRMRINLHNNQCQFPPNCIFYRSEIPYNGYLVPDINNNPSFNYENKANLFTTFQYSVTIQNAREENFFTDHLIDCLIMKTIPIYWGCPNVSEFFDTTGWIIFEDERDLLNKISNLDENHYAKHLDIVEKNFHEALKYADFYKNFERQALKK